MHLCCIYSAFMKGLRTALVLATLLVCAVLPLASSATAQIGRRTDKTKYTVFGAGTISCGRWARDKQENGSAHTAELTWLLGFVSGAGYAGMDLKKTDVDAMTLFMDNYCNAHPLETLSSGAASLVDTLSP